MIIFLILRNEYEKSPLYDALNLLACDLHIQICQKGGGPENTRREV